MSKIGFIGVGVMGHSMVRHLMKGNDVFVYTRTKEKALTLIEEGAVWCDSVPALAGKCEIIFTMLGYPSDVEEIYLGEKGIIHHAKEGAIVIDCTTSTPSLAKIIYQRALEKGIMSLDAPVSGGDIGAKNANLTIMCGGDEKCFEMVKPTLLQIGKNVILQGTAGAGQHTKMCNQIAIATNMVGVCEALIYAKAANLNVESVLDSISQGAAASFSLSNYSKRILAEDMEPGFYIKHFLKDMKIALEEAEKMRLNLPGLQLAYDLYKKVQELGYEDKGTQALICYYYHLQA